MPKIRLSATWMRGGSGKDLFFDPTDPVRRDALLLRALGSPDHYGAQIDGLGGATSSTSKIALVSRSNRPGFDVDHRFGVVAVGEPAIDWSGNCGNLGAAVSVFVPCRGLVAAPGDDIVAIRIWQVNLNEAIVAHVPMRDGQPVEDGDFSLAGVAFPGAEIVLDFLDPGGEAALLPSGRPRDRLTVSGLGEIEATLLHAGNPTVFVRAADLGLTGCETRVDFNRDAALLARCAMIRAQAGWRWAWRPAPRMPPPGVPTPPNWLSSLPPETIAPPTARRSLPPISTGRTDSLHGSVAPRLHRHRCGGAGSGVGAARHAGSRAARRSPDFWR